MGRASLVKVAQIILLSGLLPLAGLLFWDWDWRQLLIFYWLGNISGGIVAMIAMYRTTDTSYVLAGDSSRMATSVISAHVPPIAMKLLVIGQALASHIPSVLIHGVFVVLIVTGKFFNIGDTSSGIQWGSLVIAWLIGSVISIIAEIIKPAPSESIKSISKRMSHRFVALHVSIVAGTMVVTTLQLPSAMMIMLILLSVFFELLASSDKLLARIRVS